MAQLPLRVAIRQLERELGIGVFQRQPQERQSMQRYSQRRAPTTHRMESERCSRTSTSSTVNPDGRECLGMWNTAGRRGAIDALWSGGGGPSLRPVGQW